MIQKVKRSGRTVAYNVGGRMVYKAAGRRQKVAYRGRYVTVDFKKGNVA